MSHTDESTAILTRFWNSVGDTTVEEYIEALLAAYNLDDEERFGAVLCEMSTSDVPLTILKIFNGRTAPPTT